ncbi:MAG: hypothetical protein JXA81_14210 [Sedimentisphaerales bacterium]|nr:hypothetical protein [Sedimentisphaerales bacterium]
MKILAAKAIKAGFMLLACEHIIILSGTILADEKIVPYRPKAGPLLWPSEPPKNIPFEKSKELTWRKFVVTSVKPENQNIGLSEIAVFGPEE